MCFISQTAVINNNIDINIDFLKNHHSLNVFLAERELKKSSIECIESDLAGFLYIAQEE